MTERTARDEIAAVIRGFVAQELKIPPDEIADDTDIRELPGVDSVKLVRAVARIERHFDIELEDEHVFSVKTIDEITRLVSEATSRDA
jgi:acyl carrier protein